MWFNKLECGKCCQMLNCTPVLLCSLCSCTQACFGGDRNTNVCIFAIISLTCLSLTVHFKNSQPFSTLLSTPLLPTSLPPFFFFYVIEVAARAGSQGRVVRFLRSTSLSALCAGTLFPSRTWFLTAHIVAPLPFNLLHHSRSLLCLASHQFFVITRPALGQRKKNTHNISCCMGLLITLRLTLFLVV